MGEWSKKIGEVGESVVEEFFDLIGWANSQSNLTLPCFRGIRHGKEGSPKQTHGIDRLYSYESPLEDGVLNHLVTSVKYTSSPYPKTPNSVFKGHFLDLTKTLECFKKSELKTRSNKDFSGIDVAKNIGVLFWLSHEVEMDVDILQKVSGCKGLDEYSYDAVYVVDNKRVGFIYDSIQFVKSAYPIGEFEFFYPSTGKNINPLNKKSSGEFLPVEYINSSVLVFKVTDESEKKTLIISCINEFDNSSLRRLIGLAQEISQDLTASIVILFPDYNKLHHENYVSDAKAGFRNKSFTNTIKVSSFRSDFRGLADE
ncbi:GapS4a family protein [Teredinibacter haidensis]|uniref:GapS4a family protein n=1 Tax=Teredinibacter haidensis TaxID=2731755 RepID=UPI00094893FA|nr:hypothetical protein [Teredinibacter haidensis]